MQELGCGPSTTLRIICSSEEVQIADLNVNKSMSAGGFTAEMSCYRFWTPLTAGGDWNAKKRPSKARSWTSSKAMCFIAGP